jgi:MoaA/NifB/PqqE/SkfB family radical SAM enzyme
MNLSIQYRGPLSSCNYACSYCPFAKRTETPVQLERDKAAVMRFALWLECQTSHRWRVLFTPWGEALVRGWYRSAVTKMTHLVHVERIAVQTNLSCGLRWIDDCRPSGLSLWATFHPTQVDRRAFVRKVMVLREKKVPVSVGVVGVPAHFDEIRTLRSDLPADVYVWVNALQPRPRPYSTEERRFLSGIDPLFELTARKQNSLGQGCRTGETVFTIDGDGDMRRCHFVDAVIGNIYEQNWESALQPRACPNRFCSCYLGIAHLESLQLERIFGTQVLERIPVQNHLMSQIP